MAIVGQAKYLAQNLLLFLGHAPNLRTHAGARSWILLKSANIGPRVEFCDVGVGLKKFKLEMERKFGGNLKLPRRESESRDEQLTCTRALLSAHVG